MSGRRGSGRASEARLDALREEATRGRTVAGAGARPAGAPMPPPGQPRGGTPGYHGRPLLKPPVWTWEVPVYFFVGGAAGMSSVIALGAHLTGFDAALVRAALWIATAGSLASVFLLVHDLGRPARFLYMLRVFKPRSPMSVGAWGLNLFGAGSTVAAVLAQWGMEGPLAVLFLPALVVGATMGGLVGTYTGVLLAATAVPAWNRHRALLPVHFGIAGLGSAAAALELLGFGAPPLQAIGVVAAGLETGVGAWVELRRHGAADRALRRGRPGLLLRGSGVLAGPVSLLLRLAGWHHLGGAAFLLGAFVSRFGWLQAGTASALDPEAVLETGA